MACDFANAGVFLAGSMVFLAAVVILSIAATMWARSIRESIAVQTEATQLASYSYAVRGAGTEEEEPRQRVARRPRVPSEDEAREAILAQRPGRDDITTADHNAGGDDEAPYVPRSGYYAREEEVSTNGEP